MQAGAALQIGKALRRQVKANRKGLEGPVDGAAQAHEREFSLLELDSVTSTPQGICQQKLRDGQDGEVCAAKTWLEASLAGGQPFALLHLSYLAFDAGREDEVLPRIAYKMVVPFVVGVGKGVAKTP